MREPTFETQMARKQKLILGKRVQNMFEMFPSLIVIFDAFLRIWQEVFTKLSQSLRAAATVKSFVRFGEMRWSQIVLHEC